MMRNEESNKVPIQKVPFGWAADFMNDVDGKRYYQHTMPSPPSLHVVAPWPRKVLKDGKVERASALRSGYPPALISCETCTFYVKPNGKKRLVMSCFTGGFYAVHDRAIAKRANTGYAVQQFAQGMAEVFRAAKIPELIVGTIPEDIFEHHGWFVVYCTQKWPRSFFDLGKYPAALVIPTEGKLPTLNLFGIA